LSATTSNHQQNNKKRRKEAKSMVKKKKKTRYESINDFISILEQQALDNYDLELLNWDRFLADPDYKLYKVEEVLEDSAPEITQVVEYTAKFFYALGLEDCAAIKERLFKFNPIS
jgi:hypothetical protein